MLEILEKSKESLERKKAGTLTEYIYACTCLQQNGSQKSLFWPIGNISNKKVLLREAARGIPSGGSKGGAMDTPRPKMSSFSCSFCQKLSK